MKQQSGGYSFFLGLVIIIASLLPSQRAESTLVPFDTTTFFSEQIIFHAWTPQFVASANGDVLTIAAQFYEANQPTRSKLIQYTRTARGYSKAWEKDLPLARLIGMASDGANFYAVTAIHEDLSQDRTTLGFRANVLMMTKLDGRGNQIWQRDLNSTTYLGNDAKYAVFSPLMAGTAAVAYGAGKIVVAVATNTLPDSNNLRHQRAQYFAVSVDGAGFAASSETSWRHSFDQNLIFDGQDFVFSDLADAGWYMPAAGITVRKIRPTTQGVEFINDQENKQGTYIYARQGESDGNQNFSFTSLGDLEKGARGYVAIFASEKINSGMMRSGWNLPINEPHNLGFVHVTTNFETVAEGSWNSRPIRGNTVINNGSPTTIAITRSVVDSNGPTTTFSRPGDNSKTCTQTGVVWLTNLPAGLSAERVKMVKLSSERFMALWEEFSYGGNEPVYSSTKAIIINESGAITAGPASINARLNPSGSDRAFVIDQKAAWLTGDSATGKISLHVVDANLALTTMILDENSNPQPPSSRTQLNAGDMLRAGEQIQSPNALFRLTYQTDGNLVLYNARNQALWSSNTNGRRAGSAIMQSDGNFVIYGPDNGFQWNTATTTAGSKFMLRDDGNLVVVTSAGIVLWTTNTALVKDRLHAGESLRPGDKLESSNGRYRLSYQTDGNLVLYRVDNNTALWSSGTNGRTAGSAIMQTDGNFVVYGPNNSFQWNTGTTSAGSFLVLQADGNLVVYSTSNVALWVSNTAR